MGIPVVNSLRDDPQLQALSRVWPFEAGVPASPVGTPSILHAEIWPSIVDVKSLMARPENDGKVLDEVQVEQLALTCRMHDAAETLADLFAAAPPAVVEKRVGSSACDRSRPSRVIGRLYGHSRSGFVTLNWRHLPNIAAAKDWNERVCCG